MSADLLITCDTQIKRVRLEDSQISQMNIICFVCAVLIENERYM